MQTLMPRQLIHSCIIHSLSQLPREPYPTTDMTRVYRDVLKYGSLLNKSNFSTLFPFLYFDLTKQKMDIKDGTTKLTFKYELSGTTATAYSIYALTLYEQDVELIQKDGKIILRS